MVASSATMFVTQSLRGMLKGVPKVSASRSLSTTTSLAARPSLRPAPKKPSHAPPKGTFAEAALPALSLLKSAKKAGVLKIEPDRALSILRRYVELSDENPNGKWEKHFCAGKSGIGAILCLQLTFC
jgi:hypothetical protein